MATIDTEENRRLNWQEEIISRGRGWQARDEAEFFGEEVFPNLSEEEKEEVMELLLKVFYL